MKKGIPLDLANKIMEKIKDKLGIITQNTLIPISLLIVVVGASIWLGALASEVKAMAAKDSPSRTEFNTMCEQLSTIQKGVNEINSYLRDKSK